MAALSGLSPATSSDSSLPIVTTATVTWTDLNRRQCRVISSASEVEKRLVEVEKKLERLGWCNTKGKGQTVEGTEWKELADRQQELLQNICSVKDRLKSLGFRVGITNPAYEEGVAKPQLMRKVPSHFNNKQITEFLQRGVEEENRARDEGRDVVMPTATFPLTKQLVMVFVRDLQRFILSGLHRPMAEMLPSYLHSSGSEVDAPSAAAALFAADRDGRTFRFLMRRMMYLLCAQDLSDSDLEKVIEEGSRLLALSLQLDSDTREILHAEPFLLDVDNLLPSASFTSSLAAFSSKQARSWFTSGVSPFTDFQFTRPPRGLEQAKRIDCPQCKRPSSLYCPFCMVPTLIQELQIPPIHLPLDVDILHHVGENVKKSTSIHACILAPTHCRFLEFPEQLPQYDKKDTILLYPTNDAVYLDDERIDLSGIKRLVVIESTWTKSDVVAAHPSLAGVRRVKIRDHESTFWRYQELGRNFLSTLEAIYWTQKEFVQRQMKSPSTANGSVSSSSVSASSAGNGGFAIDDLLYFYSFQHSRITDRYKDGSETAPRSWSGGAVKPSPGKR